MLRGRVHQASDYGAHGPWPWTALDRIVGPLWPRDSAGRWENAKSTFSFNDGICFNSRIYCIVDSVYMCTVSAVTVYAV